MSTDPKQKGSEDKKETPIHATSAEPAKTEAPKEIVKTEAPKAPTPAPKAAAKQEPSTLQFKKLNKKAVTPKRSTSKSSGLDLVCTGIEDKGDFLVCLTGIAVQIPEGYTGYLHPRSSIFKKDLVLANGVGVIDEDYRGEIKAIFRKIDKLENIDGRSFARRARRIYAVGDKVAQLVILRDYKLEVEEVDELTDTERGKGGFGSTGQ